MCIHWDLKSSWRYRGSMPPLVRLIQLWEPDRRQNMTDNPSTYTVGYTSFKRDFKYWSKIQVLPGVRHEFNSATTTDRGIARDRGSESGPRADELARGGRSRAPIDRGTPRDREVKRSSGKEGVSPMKARKGGIYPGYHYLAFPIKTKTGWKCSGCGWKAHITPSNRQAVSAHITQKQNWERNWQVCSTCKGRGKISANPEGGR